MEGVLNNGRVDLLTAPLPSALVFQAPSLSGAYDNTKLNREAIQGVVAPTPLSDLFFSPANVEALHQGIRYKAYVQTGSVIGRQSDSELRIYMRAVFLTEARFLSKDLLGQVRVLNASVLKQTVPNIVGNFQQHEAYKKDVSRLPTPFPKAVSTSGAGSKIIDLGARF